MTVRLEDNHQKMQTVESGRDTGLRCLHVTRKEALILAVFGIAGGAGFAELAGCWYEADWAYRLSLFVVHGWLLGAAWSDLKCRKVSNQWCLFGVGAAVSLLIVRLTINDHSLMIIPDILLGAFLTSGTLFAGAMFRRRGIGMGDVKAFFVLGLFLGTETACSTLLVALVIALAVAAAGIIGGKIGRSHRLPLCPFAYMAMILTVLGGF